MNRGSGFITWYVAGREGEKEREKERWGGPPPKWSSTFSVRGRPPTPACRPPSRGILFVSRIMLRLTHSFALRSPYLVLSSGRRTSVRAMSTSGDAAPATMALFYKYVPDILEKVYIMHQEPCSTDSAPSSSFSHVPPTGTLPAPPPAAPTARDVPAPLAPLVLASIGAPVRHDLLSPWGRVPTSARHS